MVAKAHIQNGIVVNLSVADALLDGDIDGSGAQIGDLYVDGAFVPPAPVPPTREQLKAQRDALVAALQVTTTAGNVFDGDETSQTRMARAIIALGTGLAPSVTWVLADNSVIDATAAELTEALALAGMAQAAVWVLPYEA